MNEELLNIILLLTGYIIGFGLCYFWLTIRYERELIRYERELHAIYFDTKRKYEDYIEKIIKK